MLASIFVAGLVAMQSAAALTPEAACGPEYHVFGLDPVLFHPITTVSLEQMLSGGGVVVEGVVTSKRTYSPGSGVYNDVVLRVKKVLKGPEVPADGALSIHVPGGYAGYGHTCLQDTLSDGARIEVGKSYLVLLTKEVDTGFYRAGPDASWFRISEGGSIIPLTPALVRNRALSDKKITDFEERAKSLE